MRNSALASAALTSVALLAQTAGAAPSAADETPSREEVSRRVSSLYDQAESDTGTFNATRAAAGPRGRVDRSADAGRRSAAATRSDESRRSDPALAGVTRQWFDMARAKLGPTVPATLPGDRTPDRPAATRPTRPAERAGGDLSERGREASGRAALELPAAPVAELTSAPADATAPLAELTGGPVAALPAAPEAPREITSTTQGTLTPLALPAPTAEPEAEPHERSSLQTTKEQNQRKLAQARELLSAYASRQSTPLMAIEAPPAADTWSATPAPVEPWAETQWQALQGQGAADLTPVSPGTTTWFPTTGSVTDTLATTTTGSVTDSLAATTTGSVTGPLAATATTATTDPLTGTTTASVIDPLATTTTASVTNPLTATTTTAVTDPLAATMTTPVVATPAATTTSQALDTSTRTTSTAPQDIRALRALDFARAQIGKPCVWGTTGPNTYDGAGLTQAAWKAAGIALPRTAQEQASAGRGIALTYLEPGDLVLFHVGHVGLYSGNGMMIHAPGPGSYIREESIYYAGESAIHSAIRPS